MPFILSLRQTDYSGHIVVIGYGLTAQKIEILHRQGVNVFVGTHDPLAVGRFIEVAEICRANPEIGKIALYDADIWFPNGLFDLFESVDGDALFACTDPMFCNFVTTPLIGPRREENFRLVVDRIGQIFGGALQAGLLAGTAKAWRDFAEHVQAGLSRVGEDFNPVFGFDTTLLHLWGAQGRVARLPQTQNFILKSGLIETYDYKRLQVSFASADGPIRGLHMSGDIRFMNRWRYFTNRPDHALEAGRDFALSPPDLAPLTPCPADGLRILREFGMDVASLLREGQGYLHVFAHEGNVLLQISGNHALTLTAADAFAEIHIYMTHISGFPSPIAMAVELHGRVYPSVTTLQTNYAFRLAAGDAVTLRATSLGGQMCGATWILARSPYIKQ